MATASPQHHVTLPRPKGRGRTFDRLELRRVGGYILEMYAVRLFVLNTHPYAKNGREGAPGPVIGYGMTIEDAEGITVYTHEERDRAAIAARFERAAARAATPAAGAR